MANLERARQIIHIAHDGQFRRTGEPYATHPIEVMETARALGCPETTQIVAALHDVPEMNPDWPLDRLREEGFDEDAVITPVGLLTRHENDLYLPTYIDKVLTNETALTVKLIDMGRNSGRGATEKQLKKYREAFMYIASKAIAIDERLLLADMK